MTRFGIIPNVYHLGICGFIVDWIAYRHQRVIVWNQGLTKLTKMEGGRGAVGLLACARSLVCLIKSKLGICDAGREAFDRGKSTGIASFGCQHINLCMLQNKPDMSRPPQRDGIWLEGI